MNTFNKLNTWQHIFSKTKFLFLEFQMLHAYKYIDINDVSSYSSCSFLFLGVIKKLWSRARGTSIIYSRVCIISGNYSLEEGIWALEAWYALWREWNAFGISKARSPTTHNITYSWEIIGSLIRLMVMGGADINPLSFGQITKNNFFLHLITGYKDVK